MVDTSALKAGDLLGGFNFNLGAVGNILVWLFICFIIFAILIGIVIFIIYRRMYNQNILIFGLLGNVPTLKKTDKAKIVKFGLAGDTLFYLQSKKYITPPNIQMAIRTWWFWERADGELINFGLDNVDETFKKAGVYYIDTDMRMQRLGIEKNLRDRFDKPNWWSKYGTTVMGIIFVLFVTIALVVLFSKLVDVSKSLDATAQSVNAMATAVNKFYSKTTNTPIDTSLTPVSLVLSFIRGGI